jgi:DNA (cytosine-5)-methyltransferase 1
LVHAFLIKYYGVDQNPEMLEPLHTVTTRDRFALVTVEGEEYYIADIGMRMLAPHELFRAQGFRSDYIINPIVKGKAVDEDRSDSHVWQQRVSAAG